MRFIRNFWRDKTPEKLFLMLAIPFMAIFIVAIPALQGWDESTHFLRAYQVSTGDFESERIGRQAGGPIPINVSNMSDAALMDLLRAAQSSLRTKAHLGYYKTYLKQNHPDKNIVNKIFSGSAVYSPVSYAPQSLGMYLARTLRLPLISYIFIGRLFNAAFFITLVYWAIRLAPRGKWALLAIGLLPTTLAAASTLSPDALINGAALLLIAIYLKGLLGDAPLRTRYLLTITAMAIILSLTKEAYFMLALLPLCLPPKRAFGSIRRYLTWNIVFVVLALGTTLLWFHLVKDTARYSYLDTRPNLIVNSAAQTSYILHHPLNYLVTLIQQAFMGSNPQLVQMVGVYTWKGITVPLYMIMLIYTGLILAFTSAATETGRLPVLTRLQRRLAVWGPLVIGLVSAILIYTGLYLYFSTVRENQVEGVQGRYFIPLLGLLLPLAVLAPRKKDPLLKLNQDKLTHALTIIFVFQNLFALFAIVSTNYIPHIQFV